MDTCITTVQNSVVTFEQGDEVLDNRDVRESYAWRHIQPGVMLMHQQCFISSCMRAMLVITAYERLQKGINDMQKGNIYAQRGSDHVQKDRNKALAADLRWVNQAGGQGQCGRQS